MQLPVSAFRSLPGWLRPPWKRSAAVQRVSYIGIDCRPGGKSARLRVLHQWRRQDFQHPTAPSDFSGSGTASSWRPRSPDPHGYVMDRDVRGGDPGTWTKTPPFTGNGKFSGKSEESATVYSARRGNRSGSQPFFLSCPRFSQGVQILKNPLFI